MNLLLYISHFSESGIWLGKILANDVPFAKVFPRQNFALYGIQRLVRYSIVFQYLKNLKGQCTVYTGSLRSSLQLY